MRTFLAPSAIIVLTLSSATANLITLNTGVDGSGPLPDHSLELNYAIYYSANLVDNPTANAAAWNAIVTEYVGTRVPSPSNARWISPISADDLNQNNFNPSWSDAVGSPAQR